MQKFITFIDMYKLPTSVNLAQVIGFKISRTEIGIVVDFFTECESRKFSCSKQCQPTEEIMKLLNWKILDFIKNNEAIVLDFDEAFAEVLSGKYRRIKNMP